MTATTIPTPHIDRPDWLPEEVWPWDYRAIDLGGHRVAYTDIGEGPTVLLVNVGQWSIIWRDLIEELRRTHRVVVPEFPPAGVSELADGTEPSLALHADLLASFTAALDLRGVNLVAHDLGGTVAFAWAARNHQRVAGLVAINTFAWPPEQPGLRTMLRVMGSRPITAFDVGTNAIMRMTKSKFGVGRHLDDTARRTVVAGFRRPARRAFHALLRDALRATDLQNEALAGFAGPLRDKPVLTIYGEKNDPFGFQDRWGELFPHAVHHVVDGGNHFPMCDAPTDVGDRIAAWIAGRD